MYRVSRLISDERCVYILYLRDGSRGESLVMFGRSLGLH